jgi:hypothetical protein
MRSAAFLIAFIVPSLAHALDQVQVQDPFFQPFGAAIPAFGLLAVFTPIPCDAIVHVLETAVHYAPNLAAWQGRYFPLADHIDARPPAPRSR